MKAVFEAVKDEEGVNFTGKIRSFRRLVHKNWFSVGRKTQDRSSDCTTMAETFVSHVEKIEVEYMKKGIL
jgi:hypothetical protein